MKIFTQEFCKRFAEELRDGGFDVTVEEAHQMADRYADTVAKLMLDADQITLPRLGRVKIKYVPPVGVVKTPSWRAHMSWSTYAQRAFKQHIIDY